MWQRAGGLSVLVIAAFTLTAILVPSTFSRHQYTELEADPEVTAAQKAFIASDNQARNAAKQLEEIENDVPGWMTELPPSILKNTVNKLSSSVDSSPHGQGTRARTTDSSGGSSHGHELSRSAPSAKAEATQNVANLRPSTAQESLQRHVQMKKVPGMDQALEHDKKLKSLDSELSSIMSKARELKADARLAKEGKPGVLSEHPHVANSLNHRQTNELGQLFGLNTVLHSIKGSTDHALRLAHPNQPNYKPPPPPPSPAQIEREKAEEAKQKARELRRRKDADLARAEGKAALQQAARVLLRELHGRRDKWLRKTLHNIASNAAQVEVDKEGIKSDLATIRGREGKGGKKYVSLNSLLKKSAKEAAESAGPFRHQHVASSPAATSARQQKEANRLLDHMLDMAHSDFSRIRSQAPQLQAEAKDGQVMRKAGAEAEREASRREVERRKGEAKARLRDAKARKLAGRAAFFGQKSQQVAQEAKPAAKGNPLGLLANDMWSDINQLF